MAGITAAATLAGSFALGSYVSAKYDDLLSPEQHRASQIVTETNRSFQTLSTFYDIPKSDLRKAVQTGNTSQHTMHPDDVSHLEWQLQREKDVMDVYKSISEHDETMLKGAGSVASFGAGGSLFTILFGAKGLRRLREETYTKNT